MDWIWSHFSFRGRINRAKYWLTTLTILSSMLFTLILLANLCDALGIPAGEGDLKFAVAGHVFVSVQLGEGDRDTGALFPKLVTLVMMPMFAWLYAAASIKRLHDRNRSGLWIIPLVIVNGVHDRFHRGNLWMFLVWLSTLIAITWGVIEMYFLRGTNGPNQYGFDPLEKIQTGHAASAGWDQQNAIEFVPYRASAPTSPPQGAHVKREA